MATEGFNENQLTKGQRRKLNALRKSLGDKIADEAFAKWYANIPTEQAAQEDKYANLIVEKLQPLVLDNILKIPRGGYLIRRGRGRVIVEQAKTT